MDAVGTHFPPLIGFFAIVAYVLVLFLISFYRSRAATLSDYYIGSHSSTWWLITLGMISDSVSGVTFISVPGTVFSQGYSYFQIVLGYSLGYLVITTILLPLYYRTKVISIYAYLGDRFGPEAQKTASILFIASRTFGSAARLYISVMVLHQFLFAPYGWSPLWSFFFAMAVIVLYTVKGGIKSLVWTEAYQSVVLLAVIGGLGVFLWQKLPQALHTLIAPQLFFTDPLKPNFFLKQILGGMLITASMNGLDQNIMQMNLSCKRLWDAQKNMLSLSVVMLVVNFVFLGLGALAQEVYRIDQIELPHLPTGAIAFDRTLSGLAFGHLGIFAGLIFIIGLSAATFSSAGTILPSIASSIEIDLMPKSWKGRIPIRFTHVAVAVLIFGLILGIYFVQAQSLIDLVLRCSGYTYGPLIGLFGLGIFTSIELQAKKIPWVAVGAIFFTATLDLTSARIFNGYTLGVELIAVNAFAFVVLSQGIKKKSVP